MKTIVLYKSISGFTEKYARWIAEDMDCECCSIDDLPSENPVDYDIIIFGGSLHAVGISGFKTLQKRFPDLINRTVYIFATGASPGREHIPGAVIDSNFTEAQKKAFRFYYFRGGFDFSKLNPVNRFIMSLMHIKIRLTKPSKRTPDDIGMLSAFANPVDFTKRDRINELVRDLRASGE